MCIRDSASAAAFFPFNIFGFDRRLTLEIAPMVVLKLPFEDATISSSCTTDSHRSETKATASHLARPRHRHRKTAEISTTDEKIERRYFEPRRGLQHAKEDEQHAFADARAACRTRAGAPGRQRRRSGHNIFRFAVCSKLLRWWCKNWYSRMVFEDATMSSSCSSDAHRSET